MPGRPANLGGRRSLPALPARVSTALVLEAVAVLFSIVAVTLQVRQHPWGWPLTLVGVTLYAWIFWNIRLYADMGLQAVFFAQGVYGWWFWLHGGTRREEAPVRRMGVQGWVGTVAVVAVGTLALGSALARWTDAALPYMDSFLSVTSLTANLLLARKVLENWMLWVFADVLYIGMFIYKGVFLTAGLYVVFLGLATAGLLEWWKAWRAQSAGGEAIPA